MHLNAFLNFITQLLKSFRYFSREFVIGKLFLLNFLLVAIKACFKLFQQNKHKTLDVFKSHSVEHQQMKRLVI
jgi:hypothetical protein